MALPQALTKEQRFAFLMECVEHCSVCRRMRGRTKVLSYDNGNIDSKVLFLAEAPGRLGADRTAVPLRGDKAGDNFELLLSNIGWNRGQIFVTNAVLCNPRDELGNNSTPSDGEIANCSLFLRMTIDLISPDVVVTLGAVALRALANVSPHQYTLRDHVRQLVPWTGRLVMPLYHPGQRATLHRSLSAQRGDYYDLAKRVHPLRGLLRRRRRIRQTSDLVPDSRNWKLAQAIQFLVSSLHRVTLFRLAKLLYLADAHAMAHHGRSITRCVYLRQVDGPWPPDLWKTVKQLENHEILLSYRGQSPIVSAGPVLRHAVELDHEDMDMLLDIVDQYGHLRQPRLKTVTYLTTPMRAILRRERAGENMLNKVVLPGTR